MLNPLSQINYIKQQQLKLKRLQESLLCSHLYYTSQIQKLKKKLMKETKKQFEMNDQLSQMREQYNCNLELISEILPLIQQNRQLYISQAFTNKEHQQKRIIKKKIIPLTPKSPLLHNVSPKQPKSPKINLNKNNNNFVAFSENPKKREIKQLKNKNICQFNFKQVKSMPQSPINISSKPVSSTCKNRNLKSKQIQQTKNKNFKSQNNTFNLHQFDRQQIQIKI